MRMPDLPDRLVVLLIGVLVLLSPALILVLTLGFLSFTGDLLLGRVSLLELLELYLLDLMVISGVAYGLFQLVQILVTQRLPEEVDALDLTDTNESDGPERDRE